MKDNSGLLQLGSLFFVVLAIVMITTLLFQIITLLSVLTVIWYSPRSVKTIGV